MPSSSTVETNFTIIFPQPFTTLPKVIASISGDTNPAYANASDTFAMSIRAITNSASFTVNVVRVDAPTGWSQQLRINWQAWQKVTLLIQIGQTRLAAPFIGVVMEGDSIRNSPIGSGT